MRYRESDYLEVPHGNSFVWRYMNMRKFKDLLENRALYFPNANKLTDQYEVTVPNHVMDDKREMLRKEGLSGRDLEEELASYYFQTNPMKDLVLINCWSVSSDESYALWKIYLGGEKNGVAIRTTVSKLKNAVVNGFDSFSEDFFIGKVKYRSRLKHDELSRFNVITTKKPFYDFEKELRLFIINYPRSEGGYETPYKMSVGRHVQVDLRALIQRIYISPFADENCINFVTDQVEGALGRKDAKIVLPSEIRDQ